MADIFSLNSFRFDSNFSTTIIETQISTFFFVIECEIIVIHEFRFETSKFQFDLIYRKEISIEEKRENGKEKKRGEEKKAKVGGALVELK